MNKRIIAQESAFLVFPITADQESIAPLDLSDGTEFGPVHKLVIPGNKKAGIRSVLDQLGLNRHSIYQSVEAVAASIRSEYLMDIP